MPLKQKKPTAAQEDALRKVEDTFGEPYATLCFIRGPPFTREEVDADHDELVLLVHPDRNPGDTAETMTRFVRYVRDALRDVVRTNEEAPFNIFGDAAQDRKTYSANVKAQAQKRAREEEKRGSVSQGSSGS
ncbi:hypothetical protein OC845_003226, partial [Tilletia horrida]